MAPHLVLAAILHGYPTDDGSKDDFHVDSSDVELSLLQDTSMKMPSSVMSLLGKQPMLTSVGSLSILLIFPHLVASQANAWIYPPGAGSNSSVTLTVGQQANFTWTSNYTLLNLVLYQGPDPTTGFYAYQHLLSMQSLLTSSSNVKSMLTARLANVTNHPSSYYWTVGPISGDGYLKTLPLDLQFHLLLDDAGQSHAGSINSELFAVEEGASISTTTVTHVATAPAAPSATSTASVETPIPNSKDATSDEAQKLGLGLGLGLGIPTVLILSIIAAIFYRHHKKRSSISGHIKIGSARDDTQMSSSRPIFEAPTKEHEIHEMTQSSNLHDTRHELK